MSLKAKGLGAPVGSVLTGSTKFIKKARHYRKLFGGGWRQSGILAQSCLYALDNHLPRLHEDHVRAKVLETGLRSLGFELTRRVDTSMVWVDLTAVEGLTADRVCEELDKVGVRNFGGGETVMRFVVHQEISDEGVERVVQVFKRLKETGINFKV